MKEQREKLRKAMALIKEVQAEFEELAADADEETLVDDYTDFADCCDNIHTDIEELLARV